MIFFLLNEINHKFYIYTCNMEHIDAMRRFFIRVTANCGRCFQITEKQESVDAIDWLSQNVINSFSLAGKSFRI